MAPDEATPTSADSTSSPDGGQGSSDGTALTPEQRDAATFAKYGMNPDGSPLNQPAVEPGTQGQKDEPSAASADDDADDADDADADGDGSEAGDADEDSDDDGEEISDERLTQIVEAALELNPNLVKGNPKIREQLAAEIREEIRGEFEQKQAAATAGQEREHLIQQGREAVNRLTSLMKNVRDEFAKAKAGEDINESIIADSDRTLAEVLGAFGQAAVVDLRRSYDDSFAAGFTAAAKVGGPLTDEEKGEIVAIVNSANRIEADDKQGDGRFDAAKKHLFERTWEFVAKRADAAGYARAVAEAKAKRDARKGILDADAVIAATAKEAARRQKLPAAPTAPGVKSTVSQPTLAAYQAAKQAGDFELADRILAERAALPPNQRP